MTNVILKLKECILMQVWRGVEVFQKNVRCLEFTEFGYSDVLHCNVVEDVQDDDQESVVVFLKLLNKNVCVRGYIGRQVYVQTDKYGGVY